jgi:hypothetical protein
MTSTPESTPPHESWADEVEREHGPPVLSSALRGMDMSKWHMRQAWVQGVRAAMAAVRVLLTTASLATAARIALSNSYGLVALHMCKAGSNLWRVDYWPVHGARKASMGSDAEAMAVCVAVYEAHGYKCWSQSRLPAHDTSAVQVWSLFVGFDSAEEQANRAPVSKTFTSIHAMAPWLRPPDILHARVARKALDDRRRAFCRRLTHRWMTPLWPALSYYFGDTEERPTIPFPTDISVAAMTEDGEHKVIVALRTIPPPKPYEETGLRKTVAQHVLGRICTEWEKLGRQTCRVFVSEEDPTTVACKLHAPSMQLAPANEDQDVESA